MGEGNETFQRLLHTKPEIIQINTIDVNPKSEAEVIPATISKCWLPMKTIKVERQFNNLYRSNIEKLMKTIVAWKKCRGDGNCYYRAVITNYIIKIIHPKAPSHHLGSFLEFIYAIEPGYAQSQDDLTAITYIKEYFITIWNIFLVPNNRISAFINLHSQLQDIPFDLQLIRVSRMISMKTLNIHQHDDDISPYLLDGEFETCYRRISTMGLEAEGMDLKILPLGLGIEVTQINVFDAILTSHYPEQDNTGNKLKVNIICKSKGHYDSIYLKSELENEGYNLKKATYFLKYG